MMVTMTSVFTVAGIAIGTSIVEYLMELYGHGDKVKFVKIIAWMAAGYITLDAFYSGGNIEYSLSDCFIGKLPKTEEAKVHLTNQLNRLEKKYNALKEKDASDDEVKSLEILINDLKRFIYG